MEDDEYTPEFHALSLERQLQWQLSDYLTRGLCDVNAPHPEGWVAEGLSADGNLSGPVGFLVHTTGPSFKVTVELCEPGRPNPPGTVGEYPGP